MAIFEVLRPENGFVIGEIACGHEGDLERLFQLIDCVSEGGAQAIKFQIFTPLERATPDHPEWKIFNDLALDEKQWRKAGEYARRQGLIIFADVFGNKSLSIAKELDVGGFKIHSEDLLNSYFISKVAQEGKILMIGVGGAHRIEIYNLVNFLKEKDLLKKVVFMTGVQTFPTPIEAHSITEVDDLDKKYSPLGIKIGFSDHISGDLPEAKIVPLMALAKGASIIEKHITVDRTQKWEDFQSALDKNNFKEFVGLIKTLAPLLKEIEGVNSYEVKYRHTFKKSPVASKDLEGKHTIVQDDFEFVKHSRYSIPLSGINIAGKTIKKAIKKGDIITSSSLKSKAGGIIVARCTSSRLPNKATRLIQGRETIALLVERIKRCKNLDCVILATSTDSSDDVLEEIAKRENVLPFRGSLENLSLRFYEAAKHYGLNHIVRITGDDILRDEAMIDKALESHFDKSCDVTFTHNMPYGTSSEIFSLNTLETILKTVVVSSHTEYLEWYLQNNRYFSVNYVDSGYKFDPSIRLTLDYEEDFKFFSHIFKHFYSEKPNFTLCDTLEWLKEHPEVVAINKSKKAKYTSKDIDVSLEI